MSKLEELIQELCPDGVEYKPLWSVTIWDKKFNSVDRKKQSQVISYNYLLAADLFALQQENGNVFLLSTGEQTGWTTEEFAGNNVHEGEVITIPWGKSRAVTDCIKYYKGKFVTADNRIMTSNDSTILHNKYLYYVIMSMGKLIDTFYRGSGIKHPDMAKVLELKIPVPPLPVQSEIVRILDNFSELSTRLVTELTTELMARKKQYEYYKNIIFSFSSNVEWTKLSKVCEIYDSLHQTPKYSPTGFPMIRVVDVKGNVINRDTCLKVDDQVYEQFIKKYKPKVNDIVISRVGSYGNVGLVINDDVCLGQNVALISAKYCSYNFLFYYLQSNLVRDFIERNVNGASQKTLSLAKIKDIPFPKLTEKEQNRISILIGNFHKISNDISTILPAEIEARQKQYEYYRDKLLTFKQLS